MVKIIEENNTLRVDSESARQCTASLTSVGDALFAIGGKWKLRIIIALADHAKRFTDLQKRVTGISARVLSSELKDLEQLGFIRRKVTVGYPVIIEYELTPYSYTLQKVISALSEWGIQHKEKIRNERELKP